MLLYLQSQVCRTCQTQMSSFPRVPFLPPLSSFQVERVAQRKHGSIQNLAETEQKRTEARLDRKAAKRLLNGDPGGEEEAEEGSLSGGGVSGGGFLRSMSAEGERLLSGAAGQRPLTALQRQVRSRLQSEYLGATGSGNRPAPPPDNNVMAREISGSRDLGDNLGSMTNVEEF